MTADAAEEMGFSDGQGFWYCEVDGVDSPNDQVADIPLADVTDYQLNEALAELDTMALAYSVAPALSDGVNAAEGSLRDLMKDVSAALVDAVNPDNREAYVYAQRYVSGVSVKALEFLHASFDQPSLGTFGYDPQLSLAYRLVNKLTSQCLGDIKQSVPNPIVQYLMAPGAAAASGDTDNEVRVGGYGAHVIRTPMMVYYLKDSSLEPFDGVKTVVTQYGVYTLSNASPGLFRLEIYMRYRGGNDRTTVSALGAFTREFASIYNNVTGRSATWNVTLDNDDGALLTTVLANGAVYATAGACIGAIGGFVGAALGAGIGFAAGVVTSVLDNDAVSNMTYHVLNSMPKLASFWNDDSVGIDLAGNPIAYALYYTPTSYRTPGTFHCSVAPTFDCHLAGESPDYLRAMMTITALTNVASLAVGIKAYFKPSKFTLGTPAQRAAKGLHDDDITVSNYHVYRVNHKGVASEQLDDVVTVDQLNKALASLSVSSVRARTFLPSYLFQAENAAFAVVAGLAANTADWIDKVHRHDEGEEVFTEADTALIMARLDEIEDKLSRIGDTRTYYM